MTSVGTINIRALLYRHLMRKERAATETIHLTRANIHTAVYELV